MAKHCATCKHFFDGPGTTRGEHPHCRRYPPVHIGPSATRDGFVRVEADLSCGEYKKRRK